MRQNTNLLPSDHITGMAYGQPYTGYLLISMFDGGYLAMFDKPIVKPDGTTIVGYQLMQEASGKWYLEIGTIERIGLRLQPRRAVAPRTDEATS